MIRRFSTVALVVLAAALAFSACAGGGATPQAPAAKTFNIDASEFKFAPDTFNAQVGEAITFVITNNGTLEHNLVVFDPSGAELGRVTVSVGMSANLNLTPSSTGTYAIVCDIPGHREAGMEGTLTVNP